MTEKIQSQLLRMLNKVSQKFPQVEEPTVMTDIHIRINQETGDVMVFNDDEQEITRIVVDEWIDNQEDEKQFYQKGCKSSPTIAAQRWFRSIHGYNNAL